MLIEITLMACIVFLTRYFFVEPRLPIKLNTKIQTFLGYSSFAVLSAIAAPIVFTHQNTLTTDITNPYIIAGVLAVLLAWKTKNVLLTTVGSMSLLVLMQNFTF